MTGRPAERRVAIAAAPWRCFDTLVDYESFPEWQRDIRSVEVVTRDAAGRGHEVAFELDGRSGPVSYRLRYSYEPPALISWEHLDGAVEGAAGQFALEADADGGTVATYRLAVPSGGWLPRRVARMLAERVMAGSLAEFKRRAETAA